MIGIYKITNPNGKIYIGQSTDIEKRFNRYKQGDCKNQRVLFNSLIKYGWSNHTFEIIEECEKHELNKKERYYQDIFNVLSDNGLNSTIVEENGIIKIFSCETIENMSVAAKKRIVSEIRKQHQSKMLSGRKYTDEHKSKISAANKGKEHWWNKGKPTSEYQKQMASIKNKVKVYQYDINLNFIKEWDSIKSAGAYFNSKGTSITDCAKGKNKTAFGFKWFYTKI